MAVVILGGLLTSMLLNMMVLPALYLKFGRPLLKQNDKQLHHFRADPGNFLAK